MATEPTLQNTLGANAVFQTINSKKYLCLCIDDWKTAFNDPDMPDEPTGEQALAAINAFAAITLTEENRDGNIITGTSGTPNQMVAFSAPSASYTERDGKTVRRVSYTFSLDVVDESATVIKPSKY
jgi:hypothetical protein